MESENNSFSGTGLDGHILNFNWTVNLVRYTNFISKIARNVRLSPEFSMSNACPVKWKMVFKGISQQQQIFKIGLKRTNAESGTATGFCSVNIKSSGGELLKKESFNVPSLQMGTMCLSQEIQLSSMGRHCNDFLQMSGQFNTGHKEVHLDGIITIQSCCEAKKEIRKENTLADTNVSQLQQDFKTFFKTKQITDVTLNVKNEVIPAHKFVLSARSPVFQRMFSQDMVEGNQNNVRVDDIDKPVMEAFLSFLYTGVLEDREFNTVFELYSVADKYEVTTLFNTCRDILTSCISIHTVTPLLKLADMHSDEELKDTAVKYICGNFSKVETTAEWEELLDTHPRLASHTLRKVSSNISK